MTRVDASELNGVPWHWEKAYSVTHDGTAYVAATLAYPDHALMAQTRSELRCPIRANQGAWLANLQENSSLGANVLLGSESSSARNCGNCKHLLDHAGARPVAAILGLGADHEKATSLTGRLHARSPAASVHECHPESTMALEDLTMIFLELFLPRGALTFEAAPPRRAADDETAAGTRRGHS